MTFERSRLRGEEPGRRRLPAWVVVVAAAMAGVGIPGRAQDEGVDTKRLVQLIDAGEYRAAVAEAKALEETVRPKAKDAAYVPRVRAAVELLLTQGMLERRMGDLDAAETTLGTAFKAYTDREFQRRLALAARSAGEQAAAALVPYELVFVDLLDEGLELVIDRLRRDGATAEPEKLTGWLGQFEQLSAQAKAARQGLAERLESAGPPLALSPRARVTASEIEPLKLAGSFLLAQSRLPAPDKAAADTVAGRRPAPKKARQDAVENLARAVEAGEALLLQPADGETGAGGQDRDDAAGRAQAAEAELIMADLRENLAEARLFAGDADGAREAIEQAIASRTVASGDAHPDLVRSTILYAGIVEAQRRASESAGRSFPAREQAKLVSSLVGRAGELLKRHDKLFSADWPWRGSLAAVAKNAAPAENAKKVDPATADAVDAAAERVLPLLRALP
jgi:hypothetical protein